MFLLRLMHRQTIAVFLLYYMVSLLDCCKNSLRCFSANGWLQTSGARKLIGSVVRSGTKCAYILTRYSHCFTSPSNVSIRFGMTRDYLGQVWEIDL